MHWRSRGPTEAGAVGQYSLHGIDNAEGSGERGERGAET